MNLFWKFKEWTVYIVKQFVAEHAEERKVGKYCSCCLPASHLFCPVVIETLGAVGPQ